MPSKQVLHRIYESYCMNVNSYYFTLKNQEKMLLGNIYTYTSDIFTFMSRKYIKLSLVKGAEQHGYSNEQTDEG